CASLRGSSYRVYGFDSW
nr:immunoglobulin heavy chain junction region [Macaca mulatta]